MTHAPGRDATTQGARSPQPLREALAGAVGTEAFWLAVARHALPVLGVAAAGWSALHAMVMYVLESWLFLTMRAAVDITFDPGFGGVPSTRGGVLRSLLVHGAVAAAFFALVVLGIGAVVIASAFPDGALWGFLQREVLRPSFAVAVAGMVLSLAKDMVRDATRLQHRSEAEQRADDWRIAVMFYRVILLVAGSQVLPVAALLGLGPLALVAVMSAVLVYFEAMPAHAAQAIGFERWRGDRRDGGRVSSSR